MEPRSIQEGIEKSMYAKKNVTKMGNNSQYETPTPRDPLGPESQGVPPYKAGQTLDRPHAPLGLTWPSGKDFKT